MLLEGSMSDEPINERMSPAYIVMFEDCSFSNDVLQCIESVIDGAEMCSPQPLAVSEMKEMFVESLNSEREREEISFIGEAEAVLIELERSGVLVFTPILEAEARVRYKSLPIAEKNLYQTWWETLNSSQQSHLSQLTMELNYQQERLFRLRNSPSIDELTKLREETQVQKVINDAHVKLREAERECYMPYEVIEALQYDLNKTSVALFDNSTIKKQCLAVPAPISYPDASDKVRLETLLSLIEKYNGIEGTPHQRVSILNNDFHSQFGVMVNHDVIYRAFNEIDIDARRSRVELDLKAASNIIDDPFNKKPSTPNNRKR